MINWVRFHLGVKDSGAYIWGVSEYSFSTLYKYITTKTPELMSEKYAKALDESTTVIAQVIPLDYNLKGRFTCNEKLTK